MDPMSVTEYVLGGLAVNLYGSAIFMLLIAMVNVTLLQLALRQISLAALRVVNRLPEVLRVGMGLCGVAVMFSVIQQRLDFDRSQASSAHPTPTISPEPTACIATSTAPGSGEHITAAACVPPSATHWSFQVEREAVDVFTAELLRLEDKTFYHELVVFVTGAHSLIDTVEQCRFDYTVLREDVVRKWIKQQHAACWEGRRASTKAEKTRQDIDQRVRSLWDNAMTCEQRKMRIQGSSVGGVEALGVSIRGRIRDLHSELEARRSWWFYLSRQNPLAERPWVGALSSAEIGYAIQTLEENESLLSDLSDAQGLSLCPSAEIAIVKRDWERYGRNDTGKRELEDFEKKVGTWPILQSGVSPSQEMAEPV